MKMTFGGEAVPLNPNRGQRAGYTLIEMVAAMAASSLLLLALASAVAISTALVEPSDEAGRHSRDRMIFDRLSHDLRYATVIDATDPFTLAVERMNLENVSQSLIYNTSVNGLTRQLAGGPAVQLDQSAPSMDHYVDGYSAATPGARTLYPRVRGVSTAATDDTSKASISIDVPDGARIGDLLLLVKAYRNTEWVSVPVNGWNLQHAHVNAEISLAVHWKIMSPSTLATHELSFTPGGDVAAAMLAIELTDAASPFGWTGSQLGTSVIGDPGTYPQPLEDPLTLDETSLSVQLFASQGAPTPQTSLGIASFSDCVNLVGSPGTGGQCSLGIAFRTGMMPTMATSPGVLHQQSANWITIGIEVEGASE